MRTPVLLATLALVSLGGCATSPIPIGLPCSLGPPPLSKEDHLTRATKEWVVVVAETGQVLCRWKAP